MPMLLTSPAFQDSAMMPGEYAYRNKNISPPLQWTGIPHGTKTFALICDDPDAPVGNWVHWVVYNIPASSTYLPANVPQQQSLPDGMLQGRNDYGFIGYGGPAPPSGTHRYFFKLYALDVQLSLPHGATKAQLIGAMEGHILAEAQLMGKYSR